MESRELRSAISAMPDICLVHEGMHRDFCPYASIKNDVQTP